MGSTEPHGGLDAFCWRLASPCWLHTLGCFRHQLPPNHGNNLCPGTCPGRLLAWPSPHAREKSAPQWAVYPHVLGARIQKHTVSASGTLRLAPRGLVCVSGLATAPRAWGPLGDVHDAHFCTQRTLRRLQTSSRMTFSAAAFADPLSHGAGRRAAGTEPACHVKGPIVVVAFPALSSWETAQGDVSPPFPVRPAAKRSCSLPDAAPEGLRGGAAGSREQGFQD